MSASRARRLRCAATKRRLYEDSQRSKGPPLGTDALIEHVKVLTATLHSYLSYTVCSYSPEGDCAHWNLAADVGEASLWEPLPMYAEPESHDSVAALLSTLSPQVEHPIHR